MDEIVKNILKYIDNVCGTDNELKTNVINKIVSICTVRNTVTEDAIIMKNICTIGTSNYTLDNFYNILTDNNIQTLIDVRSNPTSKYSHFKRENLETFCNNHDIEYWWLGDILGGRQDVTFKQYTKTEQYQEGINKLKEFADIRNVVICCSEKNYKKCHRRYIAETLKNDYNIKHI